MSATVPWMLLKESMPDVTDIESLYKKALRIADTYGVGTPPDSVVLYSVSYLPTTENRDKAFAYIAAHPDSFTIEKTECGQELFDLGIGYRETGLSAEQVAEIWGRASARFIRKVSGNVTAFVDGADPRSVFCRIERPGLLENNKVKTINGIDKKTFFQSYL